jgi:branched-subunit amino acid aminotransferase/4-amino-4-deoxychorismate lyase
MHYYLADQLARRADPGSRAVLLDQEGYVSEASTANILIYRESHGLCSPPLHRILPGVSLTVLHELAEGLGLGLHYEDFRMADMARADEILLCSTSPCVWPATRLNGQPVGEGTAGPIFRRLLGAWSDRVGLDIAAQAQRFAGRR